MAHLIPTNPLQMGISEVTFKQRAPERQLSALPTTFTLGFAFKTALLGLPQ